MEDKQIIAYEGPDGKTAYIIPIEAVSEDYVKRDPVLPEHSPEVVERILKARKEERRKKDLEDLL
ncbi:MAG TPA: hypothetical protein VJB94_00775 [Candidatus Nanoarchaeia archaeon]|nr:hypothetical protein [Candidatus Nanoarchaeia archaeon]